MLFFYVLFLLIERFNLRGVIIFITRENPLFSCIYFFSLYNAKTRKEDDVAKEKSHK